MLSPPACGHTCSTMPTPRHSHPCFSLLLFNRVTRDKKTLWVGCRNEASIWLGSSIFHIECTWIADTMAESELKWACGPPSHTAHLMQYLQLRHRTKLYTPRATIMSLKAMWSLSGFQFLHLLSLSHYFSILGLRLPLIHCTSPSFMTLDIISPCCGMTRFVLRCWSHIAHLCRKYSLLWCVSTQTTQWDLSSSKNKWFWLTCNQIMLERERWGNASD